MNDALLNLAKRYIGVIEMIEKTSNPIKLQALEERRADLHWEWMNALKAHGIPFLNRDHATRIAIKTARDSK